MTTLFPSLSVDTEGLTLKRQLIMLMSIPALLVMGCRTSIEPATPPSDKEASQPSAETVPNMGERSPIPDAIVTQDEDIRKVFLLQDSCCRDVLTELSLSDFLKESPSATKDEDQSRAEIGYAVYQDSMFMYEFLDGGLFAIRYIIPKSAESASQTIAEFQEALGPPTNTDLPSDFRQLHASRFLSWDLPEHNLRINFAYFAASFAEADLDLFGQFINFKKAQEYLRRTIAHPRASNRSPEGTPSLDQRALQSRIDDPQWGRVAATVHRLCAGQLPDYEIPAQVLKTTHLAQAGHFSVEFTLQALLEAEILARQRQLPPAFAVQVCQQSLAFGGAAADQVSPQSK